MARLRRWQLGPAAPISTELAADARLSATDYTDDQVWRLQLGEGESPALALQTRFGGRAGLASLVPMWNLDGRIIYQAVGYTTPPVITAFAPGFLQAQARLTPQLALRAEFWAMSSHATGARFTLANTSTSPITVRLDIYGHVGIAGKERRLQTMALAGGAAALDLSTLSNIHPVVVLEGATADPAQSARIGVDVHVPANGRASARYVVAGQGTPQASFREATRWLGENWADAFQRIAEAATAIPDIETGDRELDAAIAMSFRQLVQSFLRPTSSLPHASLVAARQHDRGYSVRGDGSDYPRAWAGQAPPLCYLSALAVASIAPEWAHGLVMNYLAVQREDGWIDWKPGLGGQKQGVLCLPILARLAWGIFQYTEDDAFLRAAFPSLLRFFERWFGEDLDADGDGVPEWQAETQTGYAYFPTFAQSQPWGQHADIRLLETPDLTAYLLSEALSLREIAYYLRNDASFAALGARVEQLAAHLEGFWQGDRYAYRDRDTHQTAAGVTVLKDASAAEEQFPALSLDPPARLIAHITGGLEHVPPVTLYLQGMDASGEDVTETTAADAFFWANGRGSVTTQTVFSQIDRIWTEGVIKVYRLDVQTVDTSRRDLNSVLPLWAVSIPDEHDDALIRLVESDVFMRPNGVTMCASDDPAFDPANGSGSGGVWPYWLTLVGEGLIEHGEPALAGDLLSRLLRAQLSVLKRDKHFSEFYHSDEPLGLGESAHAGGIMPLHLLLRVIGVRVISAGRVWTGGAYTLSRPVTITQHGVRVERRPDGTTVTFPTGHTVTLPSDAPLQAIDDPTFQFRPRSKSNLSRTSGPSDDLFDG